MKRSPVRRTVFFFAFMSMPVLVLGCPKKQPPVEDAAPPPPPASTPEVTEIAPLTEDAGDDGEASVDAGKKYVGPGVTPNQQKIKMCCNALRAQAKTIGPTSPEGFQLNAVAVQCDVLASQVGPQGAAPEFNQLRQVLKSVKLPSACQM